MSKKEWIFLGVAFAVGLALANSTAIDNAPGVPQLRNLGYNLGHGNGFSTQP